MTPVRGPVCVLRVIANSVTSILVIKMFAVFDLHRAVATGR